MQCRSCGTEIADRAIVCYRCGHPTTDPVRRPVPVRPKRTPLFSIVTAAILALLAGSIAYTAPSSTGGETWRMVAGALGGAAALVLVLGLLRRR